MRKIPTLFKRDPDDMRHVLPEVTPGCEWVLAGEGVATRKYDGTCVALLSVVTAAQCAGFAGEREYEWFARREVKPGKQPPANFVPVEHDETTGKTVGWEPISQSPFAKFHAEALGNMVEQLTAAEMEATTYELCGPKINGNPEGYPQHELIRHNGAETYEIDPADLTFERLAMLMRSLESHAEGIVWHHPDGRMAKLKVRDFS